MYTNLKLNFNLYNLLMCNIPKQYFCNIFYITLVSRGVCYYSFKFKFFYISSIWNISWVLWNISRNLFHDILESY